MKRSLVLISFVLWIVVVYAGSSALRAKCMELGGTYFRQKCYTYQNGTSLNWTDAMNFCNNLVPGFTSHLVHLLSSKTLNILYDLTKPNPTWVGAYIGARDNFSVSVDDFSQHFGRFALTKTDLINDVQVSNTYAGQMTRIMDEWVATSNWGIIMYKRRKSPPYPWERRDMLESKELYFFCQTNEQYTTSGIRSTRFNRINKPPMLATLMKKIHSTACGIVANMHCAEDSTINQVNQNAS